MLAGDRLKIYVSTSSQISATLIPKSMGAKLLYTLDWFKKGGVEEIF